MLQRLRPPGASRPAVLLAAVLAGPGQAAAASGTDVTPLFVPAPSAAEVQAVRDEWAARVTGCAGWSVECDFTASDGHRVQVVSHVEIDTDGTTSFLHYALVRWPLGWSSDGSYPVVLALHGGWTGTDSGLLAAVDAQIGAGACTSSFFLVVPTFRSESVRVSDPACPCTSGQAQSDTWFSGGLPSSMDRDADDVLALLECFLANVPQADRLQVAARGTSRGGALALLLAARDPRIRKVLDYFGMHDSTLPSVRADVQAIADGVLAPDVVNAVSERAWLDAVKPWIDAGAQPSGVPAARRELIRRSPAFFATAASALQAHHGDQDPRVPIEQSRHLRDVLAAAGGCLPSWDYHEYAGGQHAVESLTSEVGTGLDQSVYASAFLCPLATLPDAYCSAGTNADGRRASIGWLGGTSVSCNRFTLTVGGANHNAQGVFLAGGGAPASPPVFGNGYRCVVSGGLGTWRLYPIQVLDTSGSGVRAVDLWSGAGAIFAAGGTWYFQFLYRDAGSWNGSDGVAVAFTP